MKPVSPLHCWKCAASLEAVPLPLSRQSECPQCRAWLHCCRMCLHFNPRSPDRCREERAEHVRDREAANFCDWFAPHSTGKAAMDAGKAASAKAGLAALFGEGDAAARPSNPLDSLIAPKDKS